MACPIRELRWVCDLSHWGRYAETSELPFWIAAKGVSHVIVHMMMPVSGEIVLRDLAMTEGRPGWSSRVLGKILVGVIRDAQHSKKLDTRTPWARLQLTEAESESVAVKAKQLARQLAEERANDYQDAEAEKNALSIVQFIEQTTPGLDLSWSREGTERGYDIRKAVLTELANWVARKVSKPRPELVHSSQYEHKVSVDPESIQLETQLRALFKDLQLPAPVSVQLLGIVRVRPRSSSSYVGVVVSYAFPSSARVIAAYRTGPYTPPQH